jgi:UDP-N-acetyl-D-glucosamine dehydrogenase
MKDLLDRIERRQARLTVIGLGYVGLPLAVELAKAGFEVTGIDMDSSRVENLSRGVNYIPDVDDGVLEDLVKQHRLSAVDCYDSLAEMDVAIICVPTPLTKHK